MRNLLFSTKYLTVLLLLPVLSNAQTQGKKLYLPPKIYKIPDGNNFNDTSSKYNFAYHAESPDFAMFWAKEIGRNPSENTGTSYFSTDSLLSESERFYHYYIDTLKFVTPGHSVSDKYKILFIIFDGKDGTAFGGSSEDSANVGIFWTPPIRINRQPYGVVAHELGHVFQYYVTADGGEGFKASPTMYEMTSQYMLWQVYPNWLTFENYHLKAFLDLTNLAFLHPDNQYHSPFVLEYWSEKHGKDFIGKLWRSAQKGEDAVMTYKRLNSLSQAQFNDEMFDACRHFVNWNMPRIKEVAAPYAHLHHTKLVSNTDGYYQPDSAHCPQNYGYNAIPLQVLTDNKNIQLQFDGDTTLKGYNVTNSSLAGWRYGFVAENENGETQYSPIYNKAKNKISYKIPEHTKYLWLVVMGAPTEHKIHSFGRKNKNVPYEQWPYRFKLSGTDVDAAGNR